jgi:hypothetical protein
MKIRFAWVWALLATSALWLFNSESPSFGLGALLAGILLAAVFSPLAWLVSRIFTKTTWKWFHWLNAVFFVALVWGALIIFAAPAMRAHVDDWRANLDFESESAGQEKTPKEKCIAYMMSSSGGKSLDAETARRTCELPATLILFE